MPPNREWTKKTWKTVFPVRKIN